MKQYIGSLLLIISFSADAQNLAVNSDCTTNPPDFVHLSYSEANAAADSENDLIGRGAKKICHGYIESLVYELQYGELSNGNKTLAIFLLGTLRPIDTNSIEVLIKDIDFRASRIDPPLRFPRWGNYPAEEALIRIGLFTVNPILNHLPNETNELRRHLMCEVLRKVETKEAAQSQFRQKLAAETDSSNKTNLEAALKELEK